MGYATNSLEYPPKKTMSANSTRLSDYLSNSWWDTAVETISTYAEKEGAKLVGQTKESAIDLLTKQLGQDALNTGKTPPSRQEVALELEKSLERKENGTNNPNMSIVNKFKNGLTKSVKELKTTSPIVTGFGVGAGLKLTGFSNLVAGLGAVIGAVGQRVANDKL